ncbi:malto-oligosyltrehalose trehalohydrolase [Agrococcus sp. SGAir0287]|uniref:malto-oligosyltrehalose trehalohydrolase n=1 Tax=Agrococcus sp. SGAir0287 TaxID=2070347 RepID=UPI0010CD1088|nr:malto-oligosyltrehalose trehalohydrolase [Agrococcus sp. SGAir0287]QCR20182.1 malto-oligosyltrehalose trehalohydrolase [Agrococcus sp. SGAir0287]
MADHEYRVWAPRATRMRLVTEGASTEMEAVGDGWWRQTGPAGEYGFQIDDDDAVRPDPRSRRQPRGVHDRSQTFEPAEHDWQDAAWTGRRLAGGVIYELHVGTFTPEGTLDAAATRLEHLVSLGVTHVEILPVNAFNGTRNWGYDGVLWYAVQEEYGGPAAYQRFVDACHAAGLAVVQDVVYNHLGPSGNYLPLYGPYLSDERNTWGEVVNVREPEVRRYVIDNALYWLRDMHVDALRLDAVHALVDDPDDHILEALTIAVASESAHQGRPLTLIAESDMNDPRLITPREGGGYGLDAQWSDDYHHAVHVALTRETTGYYADFEPLGALAKVMERGFFHDGTFSSFRDRDHGHPVDVERMPSWRLVVSAQNHDQIGNRAVGDRIVEVLDDSQLLVAAMLLYAGPYTPMLFQGEEWAASTPFQFFTSHPEEELGRLTAEGRIAEFAAMGWDPDVVPDPQDPATFERSRLRWDELGSGRHARVLEGYRRLATLRSEWAALTDPSLHANAVVVDESARTLRLTRGGSLRVAGSSDADAAPGTGPVDVLVNVGESAWEAPVQPGATLLFATSPDVALDDAAVRLPAGSGALVALPAS